MAREKESRWYYFFPGNVYAYGPTTGSYSSERAVREMVRHAWKLKRLPRGFQVWRA
ncbi:MAG: hypothetical protein KJ624_07120 [Chloroflexi bacterium]|nr:hypothetical protein [Chloroflexota bacterium]